MSTNFPESLTMAVARDGGNSFNGAQSVAVKNSTADAPSTVLTLTHNTSGTAAGGIGVRLVFAASSAHGDDVVAGAIVASHTAVTDGAEVGMMKFAPGNAGGFGEGFKVQGAASGVNGLMLTTAAASSAPVLAVYGSDTNISFPLRAKGTGAVQLQTPGGTTIFGVASTGGLTVYSDTQTGATPTVSRPMGKVRVPSGQTSVTVTNTLASASSLVIASVQGTPTNAVYLESSTPGAGTITFTMSGDPGASHADIAFLVVN